ncbi:MAG TPA: PKD domain-containing protein [Gammaproteobacteria bacterium]|nr:PKD domain-containing protein [Gammaproteobacteria bacterium]
MHQAVRKTVRNNRESTWKNSLFLVIGMFLVSLFSLAGASNVLADDDSKDDRLRIEEAKYKAEKHRIKVKGKANKYAAVQLFDAESGVQFATVSANDDGKWEYKKKKPDAIPCRVLAESDGKSDEKKVEHADDFPGGCGIGGGGNMPPTANANGPYTGTTGVTVNFSSAGSSDPDGNIVSYAWDFGDSATSSSANPAHIYAAAGTYTVSLTVTDNAGDTGSDTTTAVISDPGQQPPPGDISINSTSQNGKPGMAVSELPFIGLAGYQVFAANDLGMHCGDFDTRISSILPPFNVMHTQVIQRGGEPKILGPGDGVDVVYSAASNPADPILTGINSAGNGPVLSSVAKDGTVFKTNFWDIAPGGSEPIALAAYRPFYPPGILDAFYPNGGLDPGGNVSIRDLGLPMPNVERLYLGDGMLTAEQQTMPGINGPYVANDPTAFKLFTTDQPFFINFPFGYTAKGVSWFEAAGVPLTAFDDLGQENPWQLMRVQARSGNQVLASLDTVLPISGEANCGFCHNAPVDGGNGAATQALSDAGVPVATVLDDPEYDVSVPLEVSKEYAADLNLIRLHDLKHNTNLENSTPVVCQSCHYTPALDLAHVGPKGPADADANGREQTNVRSMSNVMHSHHATVTDLNGKPLFPAMPPPVDSNGNLRNPVEGRQVLEETCYQCHPGRRTDCLRGAMANGGMLCQDCHGDMAQIGDDFSRNVTPSNPGAFELAADFYTNPATPRVPWANEPGCGSCHSGDAMDNLHGTPGTIGDPQDGIRLMQAYRTTDGKATPIVPTNKRFAENVVKTGPATGNPMLYRVSKGHEGVFCEACHGSTHGIWPNKNPAANDNVTAKQLQGHTGVIAECSTCHTGDLGVNLDGPHGMHPIGTAGKKFAEGDHEDLAKKNPDACRACHGPNGEGTVLSAMAQDRVLKCDKKTAFCPDGNSVLFPNDHQVGCTECHSNKL